MKKILVIKGHPKEEGFCNALADRYIKGARAARNKVEVVSIKDLCLERFIKFEHKKSPDLPLDFIKVQNLITWADHLVFVYPIWWATPPALMKLFLEIVLTPGFAYKYKAPIHGIIPSWDKLLVGKTARLIATMDSPSIYYKWVLRDPSFKMMKANLNFCGINSVKRSYFGSVKLSSDEKKKKWLEKAYRAGMGE